MENWNSKIILQFRTGNYITHVWFLVGRLDHYLAIRSDHPLPMANHTIRLHFSDLQSHYGQFLEISSIIIKKWYFVTKIVLTYCEKKLFKWSKKNFWRPRICKIFEITWAIYSNSERSEQFLVAECFFNLFLEIF